jgi:hypothetical protein
MTERVASPRFKARIAGVLWLLDAGVAAPFAEFFVRGRLVVYGDAAATATNIMAHQRLYRLGACAWLIALTCATVVALLLYDLLKPVSKSVSLLAAFFRLMFVAIMAVNTLTFFAPLTFLGGTHFLTVFKTDQLQALTLVCHTWFNTGYNISMVFWGLHIILIGCLIFRSTFLPRILGALLAIGGLGYLTNSFADFLAPAFGDALGLYIVVPGAVAELLLILWLLVIGVNVSKWEEKASCLAN